MLSMVSFFVSVRVGSSNEKVRSDKVIGSNPIRQYVVDLKSLIF